jgi:predicted Zn-dependent protease
MMATSFGGLYFDGKVSFGNTCQLILQADTIQIKSEHFLVTWYVTDINLEQSYIGNNKIVLKYGKEFPFQVVEITENTASFIDAFHEYYPSRKLIKVASSFFNSVSTKVTLLILMGIVSFILISYFFLIPGIAEQIAKAFPKEYEIEMGNGIYSQMETQFSVDKKKTRLANEFFQTLQINSEYPIEITVVNDEVENAFALPGGHIVVYDKMFEVMRSKEEFVALLSHEYSHVANKHTTRSLFRSLSTYLVVSLLLSDVNGITAVLIDNANQLKSLGYSRSLEQEADDKGLALMQDKGIDAQGMIDLFKHLKSATASKTEIPEIISTHPDIENRIKQVQSKRVKPRKLQVDDAKLQQIWHALEADY